VLPLVRNPKYVAIDRDGTILRYVPYLRRVEDVELVPSAGQAISDLNAIGSEVIVITNQSIVGRGLLSELELERIHRRMELLLEQASARVATILVCPHAPEDQCKCRKPSPELVRGYLEEQAIEQTQGYVIGDNETDVELALELGVQPIHVQTGVHTELDIQNAYPSVPSARDIGEAVSWILAKGDHESGA